MRIIQTVLVIYLKRYPHNLRLSQFNFLSNYDWMKNLLTEIEPELFPKQNKDNETSVEVVPSAHRKKEVIEFTIDGRREKYKVHFRRNVRGQGCLFEGTQIDADRFVVIKKYQLDKRLFNKRELYQRQKRFENQAGINLADGRKQDLRIICPFEAIADKNARCYLITEYKDASPTLAQRLAQTGPLDSEMVRQILLQILQTLNLLHDQKFCLPSGEIRNGITHGNLSLESLLWVNQGKEFYIYLTDLALWENLFQPPESEPPSIPDPISQQDMRQEDLKAVGQVGFDLLQGSSDHNLDPKDEAVWVQIEIDQRLKTALRKLLGIIPPPFASAKEARQDLLRIPSPPIVQPLVLNEEKELHQRRRSPWLAILLILGGLGLSIGIRFAYLHRSSARKESPKAPSPCCLNAINAVPLGEYNYTSVEGGSWSYILSQPDLLRDHQSLAEHVFPSSKNTKLVHKSSDSIEEVIDKVKDRDVHFGIIPLIDDKSLDFDSDLDYQVIAYDGLAVFVAFTYQLRSQGLPSSLDGSLSLEDVQKLYRGKVKQWDELKGSQLPVKLYAPNRPEVNQIFEHFVLDSLMKKDWEITREEKIETRSTFAMLRSIIQDFEQLPENKRVGGVGFSPLSMVFGQCSVYPLAIKPNNKKRAIQPLSLKNGKAIDPSTDLCDRKGDYEPNIDLFRTKKYPLARTKEYPLAYDLAVIYPRDNGIQPIGSKFVEALRTVEGQQFLREGGLIPLEKIDNE